MSRTFTSTVDAFTSEYGPGPEELNMLKDTSQIFYLKAGTTSIPSGWSKVGTGEITVTLVDSDTLITNKVESLRTERKQVMADAQLRINGLDVKIQELLAITNEVSK